MPQWTEDQKAVIEAENKELIVSAAAGSGKTAVMVERIVELVRKGYKLDRMLIITFTHAAASEMKEKIRSRLQEERHLPVMATALDVLDCSDISTIHSFCQKLIRTQFQAIGKDPMVTVCDTGLRKQLFEKAFRSAVDLVKSENDPFFELFFQQYKLSEARTMVSALHDFLMDLPDPFVWLETNITTVGRDIPHNHIWFSVMDCIINENLRNLDRILNEEYSLFQLPNAVSQRMITFEEDQKLVQYMKDLVKQEERNASELKKLKISGLRRVNKQTEEEKEWTEQFKKVRNRIDSAWKNIINIITCDEENIRTDCARIGDLLRGLARLTVVTAQEFEREKSEKYVIDFSDMEQDSLKILAQDAVRDTVQHEYDHIFVDECQDISAVQDAIIAKIHGKDNCLFMVGDVKQSIYRFRHAEPTLFMNRIETYSDDPKAEQRRIFLRANFRSRPEILETANTVFRAVMKKNASELDYEEKDELIPGRKTEGYHPVMIDILENSENDEDISQWVAVADHIVSRGTELLNEEYTEEKRNFRWRDMVILMPKVSHVGQKLASLIAARGVPVFFDGGQDFYERNEICVFRHLLEVIDHPYQDIPLIAALHASPFFFTDHELAEIRMEKNRKTYAQTFMDCCLLESDLGRRCAAAKARIDEWRFLSETLPLQQFLWRVVRESGQYALAGAAMDGELCQANLRILCNQASTLKNSGILTLHDFLICLRDTHAGGDQKSAKQLSEKDDLIRIMTMHKSKGLQFPVVFCCGIDPSRHSRSNDNLIRCHNRLGICVNYRDAARHMNRKTFASEVFEWQTDRDEKAEKIRLLYVAMTRARERMFVITGKTNDLLWTAPESDARILSAVAPIDWVMQALCTSEKNDVSTCSTQASKPWKIRHFEVSSQKLVENSKVIHNIEPWLKSVLSTPNVEQMWKETQKTDVIRRNAKTSVTSLIRGFQAYQIDPVNPDEDMTVKRSPVLPEETIRLSDIPEFPAFMQQSTSMTAAHRGTVVHHFLSLVDLSLLQAGSDLQEAMKAEKQRMMQLNLFSPDELAVIRESEVAEFFRSEIGQRLLASNEVRREWNFNLLVPEYNDMILQGIADCVFMEGNGWILLDYKTDTHATEAEMRLKYTEQLEWYARAISSLTEKPVLEKWIWALSVGEAYRI